MDDSIKLYTKSEDPLPDNIWVGKDVGEYLTLYHVVSHVSVEDEVCSKCTYPVKESDVYCPGCAGKIIRD